MLFINPQWQGSGLTNEIEFGAKALQQFFKNEKIKFIPLSPSPLDAVDNIKCYQPILEQMEAFRSILSNLDLDKIATLGGDCGVDIIPVSYLNKKYKGSLGILWIDAHADIHTPESSPSKNFHGMPIRMLLGEGNENILELLFSTLRHEQFCYLGLRDVDEAEEKFIETHNIERHDECKFEVLQNFIKVFENSYIHLDLDVLDQSEFKHTGFPTDNGFKIEEDVSLIDRIKEYTNVVGICVTESRATTQEEIEPTPDILDHLKI
jgi:arginase